MSYKIVTIWKKIDGSTGIDINNQINQINAWFVSTGILKVLVMNLNYIFLINAIHNTSVMAYKLECIAILNVKGVD